MDKEQERKSKIYVVIGQEEYGELWNLEEKGFVNKADAEKLSESLMKNNIKKDWNYYVEEIEIEGGFIEKEEYRKLKIELKREELESGLVIFSIVFEPKSVEETLLLKELESDIYNYSKATNEWKENKFKLYLT